MITRKEKRLARRRRIRSRVTGTAARPRLAIFRSNRAMLAQIIDDEKGVTVYMSSLPAVTVVKAKDMGVAFAKEIAKKGVTTVVFDRGGFRYHGIVKAFADAVREGGVTV